MEGLFQFRLYGAGCITTAVAAVFLGVWVLFRNSHKPVNRTFFFVSLFLFVYFFSFGMMSLTTTDSARRFWASMSFVGGIPFVNVALYQFAVYFRGRAVTTPWIRWGYFSAIVLTIPMTVFLDHVVHLEDGTGVHFVFNKTVLGIGFALIYFFHMAFFCVMGLRTLLLKLKETANERQRKISRFIFYCFLMCTLIYVDALAAEIPSIYPIGYIVYLVNISLMAVAIAQYQCFDVRTQVHRFASWFAVSAMVAIPFFMVYLLIRPWLVSQGVLNSLFITVPIFLFLLAYSRLIQSRIDHFFMRHVFDLYKSVGDYLKDLVSVKDVDDLYQNTLDLCYRLFGSTQVSFWWCLEESVVQLRPFKELSDIALGKDFEEMRIASQSEQAFPFVIRGKMVGMFTLGPKINGKPYFVHEIQAVEMFVGELAVSIENARMHEHYQNELKVQKISLENQMLEMKQTNEKLSELVRFKDEITQNISHEISSPLSAIEKFIHRLATGFYGRIANRQLDILLTLNNNTSRLARFVDNMLLLSKMESRRMGLNITEFDLLESCRQVIKLYKSVAQEKGIALRSQFPRHPLFLHGDPEKIHSVLSNLIANALKYTSAGQVTVKVELSGKYALVAVKDTGFGIPREHLKAIFEKFFRSPLHARDTKGAGLGLSIVKTIVESHGGSVQVNSEPEKGSVFTLRLPLAGPRPSDGISIAA